MNLRSLVKCILQPQDFILHRQFREDHSALGLVALNSVMIIYGFYLRLEPLNLEVVGKVSEKYPE